MRHHSVSRRGTTNLPERQSGGRARLRTLLATVAVGCVAVTSLLVAQSARAGSPVHTVVKTDKGLVRGTAHGDYRSFQGIPFAAPPVGKLRWAPPHPATAWTGVRNATKPGSPCPQTAGFDSDTPSTNENCLYLNVTTPTRPTGHKLPVLVFVHGGGFYGEAGSQYGGERLATKGNVIVVTINYRLGALGFLANSALDKEQPNSLSGNYGLQDQQAALRWVRHNAAAFGGDGSNVTLSGESAGGISTCAQLASPAAAGLFQRAIIESGMCPLTTSWSYPTEMLGQPRSKAEHVGDQTAADLGCKDPATVATCLRAKPVSALLKVTEGFGPVVGGGVIPVAPVKAFSTGHFNKVPVIEGSNHDEQRQQVAGADELSGHRMTDAEYRAQLEGYFGKAEAAKVMARYPVSKYGSREASFATIFTDHTWACSRIPTQQALSTRVPTYVYEFADEHAPWLSNEPKPSFPTGAYHSSELQYLYNAAELQGKLTPAQHQLSDTMIGYWTRFARTGNPNGIGTAPWLPYNPVGRNVQSLAPGYGGIHPVDLAQEHNCAFWHTTDH